MTEPTRSDIDRGMNPVPMDLSPANGQKADIFNVPSGADNLGVARFGRGVRFFETPEGKLAINADDLALLQEANQISDLRSYLDSSDRLTGQPIPSDEIARMPRTFRGDELLVPKKPSIPERLGSAALAAVGFTQPIDEKRLAGTVSPETPIFQKPPVPLADRLADKSQSISEGALERYGRDRLDGTVVRLPARPTLKKAREADQFRRERLATGAVGELREAFASAPEHNVTRQVARAFVERRRTFREGVQAPGERHRQLTPFIASIMSDPDARKTLLAAIQETTTAESDQIKQAASRAMEERRSKPYIDVDVLTVGAGLAGAAFNARLREIMPNAKILGVDRRTQLGGQFASYGSRATFAINSRDFRAQTRDAQALPGQNANLNSLGVYAPVQLSDFSNETYPGGARWGDTATINHFLSAPSVLGTELTYFNDDPSYPWVSGALLDLASGDLLNFRASQVRLAPGLGERPTYFNPNTLTAEQVLSHFADESNLFPMDRFKDKVIAIKGGGDTGRIIAELLTWLGPKEAYGKSSVQMGGPRGIRWFGVDFGNSEEFCDKNRARYRGLASYIAEQTATPANGMIVPNKGRVQNTLFSPRDSINSDDKLRIVSDSGTFEADILVDCSTLPPALSSLLAPAGGIEFAPIINDPDKFEDFAISRKLSGRVAVIGAGAKLPLTQRELNTYNSGINENTASAWANIPRVEREAVRTARLLTA